MSSRGARTPSSFVMLAAVIGCCLVSLVLSDGPATSAPKAQGTLAIGALFSLSGAADAVGTKQLKAAQLAVAQINAGGGVDGSSVRLDARDDRSDPAYGAEQMRTLIDEDRDLAVLGPTLSLVAVRAHPVANSLHTPVLSVSNTADGIVGKCPYACEWIWRNSIGASASVPANITQYVSGNHPSTAVIAYTADDHDPAGDSEAAAAAQAFSSEHVRVLGKVSIPTSGSPSAVVAKVRQLKPRVLFIATSFTRQAVKVMQEARAAGFAGTFLGGDALNSASVAQLAGRAGEGAQSGVAWYPGNDFPANAEFVRAYKQAYSAEPDQFAAWAYSGVEILVSALRTGHLAGSTASLAQQRTDVQNALADTALTTPMGPFRFTASRDVEQIVWVQAIDGHGGHRLVGFCTGRGGMVAASVSEC